MKTLDELQKQLYELTKFVHDNEDKIDFLPNGVELESIFFSGSLVYAKFTLKNCPYAKGNKFIETKKVLDWAYELGFEKERMQ